MSIMSASLVLFLISVIICDIEQTASQDTLQIMVIVGWTANFSVQLQDDVTNVNLIIKNLDTNSTILSVRGNGVFYQKERVNYTGITKKQISFTMRNVTLDDAGRYVAAASNNIVYGEQTLIVKASPTKPQIVELDIAEIGTSYHLNCSTKSNSAPNNHGLTMMSEWKRNGTAIYSGGQYIVQGTELTITNLSYIQDNSAKFTCFAYEDQLAKSNESDALIIDAKYGPDNIQLSPRGDVIRERETNQITINCTADCNPPCSFKWRKEQVFGSLATNQSLIINAVDKDHAGNYTCTVNNTVTGRSKSIQTTIIVIYGPSSGHVMLSPSTSNFQVEETTAVNINCSADCYPVCNYTWTGPHGFYQIGAFLSLVLGRDKGGTYACNAINQENMGKTASASVAITVMYGPGSSVNLGSISSPLGVNQYQKAPNITCNATCNPPCDYRWYKDGTFYSSGATLSVGVAEKSTRGNYTCQAANNFLNLNRSSSISVNITVFYGAGIVNLSVQDSNTVDENLSASFHCHVDSNPLPTITWTREDNNTVLKSESGVLQSHFSIISAQCLDMGNYSCTADNGIWKPANETLQFFVRCHPRRDFQLPMETKLYRKRHMAAVLSYAVISYPLPTFTWMFFGNGSKSRGLPVSAWQHGNRQQSELRFTSLGIDDFGNYSVIANNSIYPSAMEVFQIVPADIPDVPSNVTVVDLTTNSVTIQWVAGYNGGPEQTFHIVASAGEFTRSVTVSDPGYGKQGTVVLESLLPGTKYSIYITANNSVGQSNITEAIIIVTEEESKPVTSSALPISAVAGGIGAGIVVILLAVVAIFLWRRYKHQSQHSDGLVDNPVYDSSGLPPGDSISNTTMRSVYAEVVKPKKTADDASSLYAQVDKNPKIGNKGEAKGKSVKSSKGGAKVKGGKDSRGDIYENAVLSGKNSNAETEYENSHNVATAGESLYEDPVDASSSVPVGKTDGLLYADLMLDPPTTTNGNPVIRGIENQTEYAEIAYGKRGEPLPDISHEKEKTN